MRIRNWDVRATRWALNQVGKPFAWGATDCVSNLRGFLETIYGKPVGPVDQYDSLASALEVAKATGGVRQVLLELGAQEIPRSYANTGDVLVDIDREGDPFQAVLCVVTDKALFSEQNAPVRLLPLAAVPAEMTVYRLG